MDTIKHLLHSFSRSIRSLSLDTFIISLPDEFSPYPVSRPWEDLTHTQDWPKDVISKWLIMQTPAVLDALGFALACCLLDLPGLCLQSPCFAG